MIKKLSSDLKTTTTLIKIEKSTWKPRCVYWSPSTSDLLVGMCSYKWETVGKFRYIIWAGKLIRYNQSGQLKQTIQHNNTGRELYKHPSYITENNNGDVVVSDPKLRFGAVVVTNSIGRYRLSYTGHTSGSELNPSGICTDELSQILVCDRTANSIHVLDIDGQFLLHLPIKPQHMGKPRSLSYDFRNQHLWVGSYNNNVFVYKYITKTRKKSDN